MNDLIFLLALSAGRVKKELPQILSVPFGLSSDISNMFSALGIPENVQHGSFNLLQFNDFQQTMNNNIGILRYSHLVVPLLVTIIKMFLVSFTTTPPSPT